MMMVKASQSVHNKNFLFNLFEIKVQWDSFQFEHQVVFSQPFLPLNVFFPSLRGTFESSLSAGRGSLPLNHSAVTHL